MSCSKPGCGNPTAAETFPDLCHVPRCNEPALPHYGMCFDHALDYADRKVAEAENFRSWVLARRTGQLDLLGAGGTAA